MQHPDLDRQSILNLKFMGHTSPVYALVVGQRYIHVHFMFGVRVLVQSLVSHHNNLELGVALFSSCKQPFQTQVKLPQLLMHPVWLVVARTPRETTCH